MRRMMDLDREYEKSRFAPFRVGDTADVGVKITELTEKSGKGALEEKERVQVFNGTVIRMQGSGIRRTFTCGQYFNRLAGDFLDALAALLLAGNAIGFLHVGFNEFVELGDQRFVLRGGAFLFCALERIRTSKFSFEG